MSNSSSYSRILKSSSVVGGSQAFSMLIGMIRVKFVAVLIGPSGLALISVLQSIQTMGVTLSGLGVSSSGVREITKANGDEDMKRLSMTAVSLRRFCWLLGLVGGGGAVIFSKPISQLTFGNVDHATSIAWLSLAILFTLMSFGQMAILQGVRRIGDLALVNIISVFVGSFASIIIYWLYGIDGVVPSLISLALFNFLVSFYYARRLELEIVRVSWKDSFLLAGSILGLGLAFMWTAIMRSLTEYGTRWLIINKIDFISVGIFFAAYRLSGMFLNFVLGAMGTDFYPNLTAASDDHEAMRGLVNQQTEVGLLLALPGLLVTLALSSLVVRVFYSSEFIDAIPLLQWFVLGCLGRVISWPMGYTLLAKGRGGLLVVCETAGQCFHLTMIYLFLNHFGLVGVSIAFVLNYIVWTILLMVVSYYLIGYRWSSTVLSLVLFAVVISAVCFTVVNVMTGVLGQAVGFLLAVFVGCYCLRKLCGLVGQEHSLVRLVRRIPILRSIVLYG